MCESDGNFSPERTIFDPEPESLFYALETYARHLAGYAEEEPRQ